MNADRPAECCEPIGDISPDAIDRRLVVAGRLDLNNGPDRVNHPVPLLFEAAETRGSVA
jgi:hypothetical protein